MVVVVVVAYDAVYATTLHTAPSKEGEPYAPTVTVAFF